MTTKIKMGVLGCSSIANRSVIPSILASEHFELSAVASRDLNKAKDFAERFECDFCSYDELIQRQDVDAVYVSLPVGLHYEWGIKVLELGKHLLLEKTFTRTYIEAEEIIALAKERHLVAMEALVYVYHPLYQEIRDAIESGAIGKVRQAEAFFGFPDLPEGNIRNKKELGGGAILDALVYPLSFCLSLRDRPYETLSYNIIPHEKYDIDARGFLKVDWEDSSAFINYGFGLMYRNSCCVWGDKGYLTAERIFSRPPTLEGKISIIRQGETEKIDVPAANHFDLMLDDFCNKIIKEDATSLNEDEDILRRMKIISKMYENAIGHSADKSQTPVEVSVVIPVYFSKDIVGKTVSEIEGALNGVYSYEIVLVNDGSTDGSFDVIKKLAEDSSGNIKSINLMRNFGQHNAIMAGLHEASGEYIIFMDDDGQHDPAYIRPMIEKIRQGYDVVYTKYEEKVYGLFKKLGSKINDVMSTWLLEKPADLYLCSFKVVTRKVRDQIIRYPGPYPYIDGTIFTSTKNVTSIPAKHRGTEKEASTYSLRKLISHWLNMFTNFSVKPLRLIFFLGFFIGLGSFSLAVVLAVLRIIYPGYSPPGWTMTAALILFFGAIQLISLGLVGEYVGRILLFINKRPQFVVRDRVSRNE